MIYLICRLATYRSLLEKNFSAVGISGNYGLFMRESFDQFRLFCSGRRNCRGMLFDFKVYYSLLNNNIIVKETSRFIFSLIGFHYTC